MNEIQCIEHQVQISTVLVAANVFGSKTGKILLWRNLYTDAAFWS
jgi:hypothetical protein